MSSGSREMWDELEEQAESEGFRERDTRPDEPSYPARGKALGELVEAKQRQYGRAADKTTEVLKLLYPEGIQRHHYRDALLMVRVIDKLSRIAQRGPDGQDLGGESPWQDIAGYGLLGQAMDERRTPAATGPLPSMQEIVEAAERMPVATTAYGRDHGYREWTANGRTVRVHRHLQGWDIVCGTVTTKTRECPRVPVLVREALKGE